MKGKDLIKQILFGFLLLFFSNEAVFGRTITLPEEYGSLEAAVKGAQTGDTILVTEDLSLKNLRAQPAGTKALTIGLESTTGLGENGCGTEDFESFAEGIVISSQVPGVTFSVVGQSCSGSPTIYMRIDRYNWYGNEFASKVLLIDTGCPDFSNDHLRMIFNDSQSEISFDLGPWQGTYTVRAYSTASGGSPVLTQTISIPGTGFTGTRYPVKLTREEMDIRRVEVEASASGHESIDNLSFGIDHTPPTVEIETPAAQTCVCGEVTLTGISCDFDGAYDRDRLEYRRIYPDPNSNWVLVREYAGQPVCSTNTLYTWDTAADPSTTIDGVYLLRITAVNNCGLTSFDETTVYVDNVFSTVEFKGPTDIVGGNICFSGTVWDQYCFDEYHVDYRPVSGGSWSPVNETVYETTVINDPFATWKYPSGTPDGQYEIRVTGQTQCGQTNTVTRTLTLDNTVPIAEIISPEPCTDPGEAITIIGTAYDLNLYQWVLDRWDADAGVWSSPINTGASSVKKGVLGTLIRDMASPCPDVIRLRVWDNAKVNPCSAWGNDRHLTETFLVLKKGDSTCRGDYNGDGMVDGRDLAGFADDFGGSCP